MKSPEPNSSVEHSVVPSIPLPDAASRPRLAVVAVTRYQTLDGKLHSSQAYADEWAQWLDDLAAANEMFDSGASLLAALCRAYPRRHDAWRTTEEAAALRCVHKATKLRISHWQCHDEPAYTVERINADGSVRAGGVGGWSGYYGSNCSPRDIARYHAATVPTGAS